MKTLFTMFTLAFCSTFALAQDAGSLDVTWNKTGIKIFDVLPNESDNALAVAEQADGKILVAGGVNDGGDVEGYVAHFHPDGTLDSTFHFDGIVAIDMSNEDWDYFVDMKIRPGGKILVAAETMPGGSKDIMLVQFMPDGSLDPNFGNLGVVKKDMGDGANDETEWKHKNPGSARQPTRHESRRWDVVFVRPFILRWKLPSVCLAENHRTGFLLLLQID